ncbi:MAG TPA: hypothetical protein VMF30_18635 [Pirellulales bacterium]|nr:hypothetical protein [Pirellulales bacterium]
MDENLRHEELRRRAKRFVWLSLVYFLPTTLFAAIVILWCGYNFVLPKIAVDELAVAHELPAGTVSGPWEPSPAGGAYRQCHLDGPFHRYAFRETQGEPMFTSVEGDLKWFPIALATLAGLAIYVAAWKQWLKLLDWWGFTPSKREITTHALAAN